MKQDFSFKIFSQTSQLPEQWDEVANNNIFLQKIYLNALENALPLNMICNFIGIFKNKQLIGISISQFLDVNKLESFGNRDRCFKKTIRNFIFKNFSSHVLFIGNNMLTGQNAIAILDNENSEIVYQTLKLAVDELKNNFKNHGKKIHIITFKDFDYNEIIPLEKPIFSNFYTFSTQPNMIFKIKNEWHSDLDYVNALSKKYRDQYKRAHKKIEGVEKRKMNLEDIVKNEKVIYNLYLHVAKNAPFNTFFLSQNHFSVFKEKLKDKFLFYGYFIDNQLIGFNTLIKNNTSMETYFLGYDESIQREKMLYLNMLYDMIAYSINKGFKEIIFARTALEIKSSVGAKPEKMYGLIQHSNTFLNKNMARIFNYLEPETLWQERNPFK